LGRVGDVERAEALALLDRLHGALGAFYAGGDAEQVRELLADDIEWHVPGGSPIAGDYHGVEAVLGYFAKRRDLAKSTFRMDPVEILIGDEHVAVLTDGSAVVGGVERRWSTVGLYRIGAGRVASCWLLPLDPAAFDSIWSSTA
jgi:ketosteroid isomerase-like protein